MLTLTEDTMLGNIPKGWCVTPLREMLTAHFPGDWGDDRGPHMFSVVRSTNLTNSGRLNFDDVARRALDPQKATLLAPRAGDILLERSGGGPDQPVGRVGFVDRNLPNFAFSNFLHLLRPDPDVIDPAFLGWVLWRVNRSGRILRLEQQTTQMRNLNFRDYLSMLLPVPPPEEQKRIAEALTSVEAAITRTRDVLAGHEATKVALASDLLVGRVRTSPSTATDVVSR